MKISVLSIIFLTCVYGSVGQKLSYVNPSNPSKKEIVNTIGTITLQTTADTSINKAAEPRIIENTQLNNQEALLKVVKDNFGNLEVDKEKESAFAPNTTSKIDTSAAGYFRGEYGNSAMKYFITGHHRPLPKGYLVYENNMLLFNQLLYSPSDFFNISAAWIPNGAFWGGDNLFILTPRLTLPVNDILSIGFGSYFILDTESSPLQGDINASINGNYFAGITIGDADNNISISYAIPYNRPIVGGDTRDFDFDNVPNLQIAGVGRLGPRLSLVAEYNLATNNDSFGLLAFKSQFKKWHFNYGLAVSGGVVPFLGVQIYMAQPAKIPKKRPQLFRGILNR